MYRLRFRKSLIGALALGIGAVMMYMMRLNPFSAGTNFDLPLLWILPAQILLPLFFAFYQYRTCPTIQQVAAFFWTISMVCVLGAIADFSVMGGSQVDSILRFAVIQDGWLFHFNAVTLGLMNILAMIAAVNLMQAEQMSSYADAKVAEAQLGRLKAVKVDPDTQNKWEKAASHAEAQADGRSLRSTMTNLKAISLHDPSQTLTQPSSKEMPRRAAESVPESNSLASLLDRIGDEPAAIAGEDSGGFEPVSAAEIFAPDPIPYVPASQEPEFAPLEPAAKIESKVEAKLDAKLDAKVEAKIDAPSSGMMGNFKSTSQSSKTATPAEPLATATSQASPLAAAQAASQPSTGTNSHVNAQAAINAPSSLDQPSASNTRLQAMKRRNTSTFTKLQSLSASGTGSLKPQSLDSSPQAEPDSLKSLLDRLDDDHVQEPAQALTPPVELVLDTVFKEDGHLEVTLPSSSMSSPVDKIAVSTPDSTGAIPSAAVQAALAKAKELAAAEAEAKAEISSSGHSSVSDRLTSSAAAEAPSLANLLDTAESNAEIAGETEEPEALFAGGVDSDIDNLFSDLAPAEAQKEVESDFPKTVEVNLNPLLAAPLESAQDQVDPVSAFSGDLEEQKTEVSEDADEESTGLFEGGVDSDIDNIFSELAPPEAQKEVGQDFTSLSPADEAPGLTEEKVEEREEEEAEEPEGALFDGGVDADIDNIFSELAPAEAQKEVAKSPEKTGGKFVDSSSGDDEDDESGGTLFGAGVDSDIDNIFSELAPPEALMEVKDVLKPRVEAAKVEDFTPPEAAEATEKSGEEEEGLFGETLGEDLDNIFSGLTDGKQLEVSPETLAKVKGTTGEEATSVAEIQEIQEVKEVQEVKAEAKADFKPLASPRATGDMPAMSAEQAEEVKAGSLTADKADEKAEGKKDPASAPNYKEVKEFGRLSTKSGSLKSAPETVGTMKTIGKLLLDVKAVENIIKSGENKKIGSGLSTAKVISAARGEGIRNILVAIDTYEGVAGSLIVGHDGLVIASTVGAGWDKDMLGALSTALLSTSNLATKKLEIGKLKQMVLLTNLTTDEGDVLKTTLLTDVEVGILAVFIEQTDLSKIDGLLETIHTTIHGT